MKPLTRRQKWWAWFLTLMLAGLSATALTVVIVRWTLRATQLNP